jgi:hypothetical protein
MSVQVGSYCYATTADAAGAACSIFVPITTIGSDEVVRTLSCAGNNGDALQIVLTKTHPTSGYLGDTWMTQYMTYPPCTEQLKTDAYLAIFGAALSAVVICYSLWRVYRLVTTSARNQE